MEAAKGLADHLERWVSWVPGVGTYREREKRRETHKRIREHFAGGLQDTRGQLKRAMLEFSRNGKAELLIDLDHLSAQIQQMADTIRYASYGYGGIFDLEKVREEEINRLCSFDLSLKEDAEKLQGPKSYQGMGTSLASWQGEFSYWMNWAKKSKEHYLVQNIDVADVESAIKTLAEFIKEMGGVDLIVISAGTGEINNSLSWHLENETIKTNVSGFAALVNVAMHHFTEKGSGHLVGISSIAALRGGRESPAYNASKAFESNYLEGLRQKVRKSRLPITITDIKPGFVNTAMAKGDGIFWAAERKKRRGRYTTSLTEESPVPILHGAGHW